MDEADPKTNPIGTELVFEDDSVRVWRIDLAPGETAGWHTHYLDYTTVVIEGDLVERPNGDGTVDRIEVTPGAIMRWNQGTLAARAAERRDEAVPQRHRRGQGPADRRLRRWAEPPKGAIMASEHRSTSTIAGAPRCALWA